MILDHITQPKLRIPEDRLLPIRVLDITLKPTPNGKKCEDAKFVIQDVEVPEKFLVLRRNPDGANDTQRLNRMPKDGNPGEEKPFVGIPLQNGLTEVKTLIKFATAFFRSDLIHALQTIDKEERVTNAKNWEKEAPLSHKDNRGIILLSLGKTSEKKWLVLGLVVPEEEQHEWEEELENIDIEGSSNLTKLLLESPKNEKQITLKLHTAGSGKKAFGKDLSKKAPNTEVRRIFGVLNYSENKECLRNFDNLPRFKIQVGSLPNSSYLYFMANDPYTLETIKKIIEEDKQNRDAARASKKTSTEDGKNKPLPKLNKLPMLARDTVATIVLCAEEPGNKTKIVAREFFPEVPIQYWKKINQVLLFEGWNKTLHNFEKVAVTGPNSTQHPPSSYKLWTLLFTNLLHRRTTTEEPFFRTLTPYLSKQGQKELNSKFVARKYEEIAQIIQKANQMVELEKSGELYQGNPKIEIKPKPMKTTPQIEEASALLNPNILEGYKTSERETIQSILENIQDAIPQKEYQPYALGMILGRLLLRAKGKLYQNGRNYSIGRGIKFTRLRGTTLQKEVAHMVDLFSGTPAGKGNPNLFPKGFLPLVKKLEQTSKGNAFNAGLTAGLATTIEKIEKTQN